MKKILIFCLCLLSTVKIFAQNEGTNDKLNFSVDVQNNSLFAGFIVTDKPVVIGKMTYALDKNNRWKIGIWGASATANDEKDQFYKEIDFFIEYEKDRFYIGLWDLFNSKYIDPGVASRDYFNFTPKMTNHVLNLRTNYTISEKFPLKISLDFLLLGGANMGEVVLDENKKYKKNKFSTYAELSYLFFKDQKVNLQAIAGAGFSFNHHISAYGYGAKNFNVVNIGLKASKKIQITEKYSLPVYMLAMWNPSQEYARVQIGATIF